MFTYYAGSIPRSTITMIITSGNVKEHLYSGSTFSTLISCKKKLSIFHNSVPSRDGRSDAMRIDPVGRQETQTDAGHEIRGDTPVQQADSICCLFCYENRPLLQCEIHSETV